MRNVALDPIMKLARRLPNPADHAPGVTAMSPSRVQLLDHPHTSFAKRRMLGARADGGPVIPASLALGVRRSLGRDPFGRGRGRRRSRPRRRCRASPAARGRAASRSGRLVVIRTLASWALPICLLFRRPSSATSTCSRSSSSSSQRASRFSSSHSGSGSGNSVRWTLGGLSGVAGPVIPRLLGRVRDDRGQQPGQVVVQPGQHELRGARVGAVGGLGVEPVLEHVEVEARQLDRAELVDPLIDPVELEPLVGRPDVADHAVELAERPAVDLVQGWRGRPRRGRTAGSPRGCPAGSGTCCGSCDRPPTSP